LELPAELKRALKKSEPLEAEINRKNMIKELVMS
jgi:hypothetical protein